MNLAARSILLFLLCGFALGCGAAARQRTIRLTYESANIADDQLRAFTETRAKEIVDAGKAASKTKEQTGAELDAFLAKANKAHVSVNAVLRMVAAAAALDDDKSLAALLSVAKIMTDELKELGLVKGASQ